MANDVLVYPIRIHHEVDGRIVVVDKDNFELFHVEERSLKVEAALARIVKSANGNR